MMNKVIYVVEDLASYQVRYRVKNIIEALKDSEQWRGEMVLKKDIDKIGFKEVKILVICRQTAKDGKILKLISAARVNKVKILFDLDDAVFSYSILPVLMKSVKQKNLLYWLGYIWGIRRIAKKVDGFVTTNEFLGEMLTRTFDKPYVVIPNSLNEAQVKMASVLVKEKVHDEFLIGYFSGSPTHAKDFQMIEKQIIKFLSKYDNVKLLIVGYMKLSKDMFMLVRHGKVKVIKPVDYLKLMEFVARVDVNLAPLLINDFTNSKSELKFFEAGVVETVTIASPTYAFRKAISDGENGFLAKPGEWYDKLEYLYNNPSEREKIAKKARKYVLENYYGKKFLKCVEEAYELFKQ